MLQPYLPREQPRHPLLFPTSTAWSNVESFSFFSLVGHGASGLSVSCAKVHTVQLLNLRQSIFVVLLSCADAISAAKQIQPKRGFRESLTQGSALVNSSTGLELVTAVARPIS